MRNAISKLYNPISAPVAATRDVLAERLQSVLYNRMMENMGYEQQERLKDIAEKEAEKEEEPAAAKEEGEAKEQQDYDDDDERYDTVGKVKLVREGKRLKEFRVNGKLNNDNTRMIMVNITPHIEMRVKVIYSFKSVIYRGDGKIQPYIKIRFIIRFITRHVYKIRRDSNIHRGM